MRDNILPQDKWKFDTDVAQVFDDMLERSIPQYDLMRTLVYRLGMNYTTKDADVVDLGCSRGGALAQFVETTHAVRFVGLEISEPMVEAAYERFYGNPRVQIRHYDLREGIPEDLKASLILSVLTLQFTPIEYRQRLIRQVYAHLEPGGAMILVEKVLGKGQIDDDLVTCYWTMKRENGYSEEQIRRKALSLEGVLVPVTARWNEELLIQAGFSAVDCFWRCLNFAGWIAVKGTS